jgi:hypothetical protein
MTEAEEDHLPIAVLKPVLPVGRLISEVIADLRARGSKAVMHDDLAADIASGIEASWKPWTPPSWD